MTFDLLTLNLYSTSGVMRLNFVHSLSEIEYHGWVIDDLARFHCAILGGGARVTDDSQGGGGVDPTLLPNLART